MITKTEIKQGNKGYYFLVFFNGKQYANLISETYKTKKECAKKLEIYKGTGKFDIF